MCVLCPPARADELEVDQLHLTCSLGHNLEQELLDGKTDLSLLLTTLCVLHQRSPQKAINQLIQAHTTPQQSIIV